MYKRKQNENTYPAFDTLPNDSQYDIFRLYNIDYHNNRYGWNASITSDLTRL